jgi:hypothetical protein
LHLQHLLTDGGRPAGAPPIPPSAAPGSVIEVDRTINACGLLALAGRQHSVGYHLAGRQATARIDRVSVEEGDTTFRVYTLISY